MKLEELAIGKSAVILSVGGEGALRQHFFRYGINSRYRGYHGKVCTDG